MAGELEVERRRDGRDGPPPRVLVVDDTPANVRIQSGLLQHYGFEVLTATSGQEALDSIAANHPDLVLLDMVMPGMNGFEVCQHLRAADATRYLPVIMVTASDEQEKVRALEAGADDFLQKPLDQAELLARVRTLVRVKRYLDTIERQSSELADWTRQLEWRVSQQVVELERVSRLRRFLSPQLADILVSAEGETLLETHRRLIAVLCCRLDGFTAMSESSEPESILGVLQEYYASIGPILERFEATLLTFDEDRVRLLFNDPLPCEDPASQAVRLALAIRDELEGPLARWRRQGYELDFAAGIDLGYATLGQLGFEGRTDYGAVGTVNRLAASLADYARAGQILMSQRSHVAVEQDVDARPINDLQLEGFMRSGQAFDVRGLRGASAAEAPALTETAESAPTDVLTDREREVVELIVRGATNRQIAEALVIAEGTAVRHVANILNKLTLRSRAQVAVWAIERGMVSARS